MEPKQRQEKERGPVQPTGCHDRGLKYDESLAPSANATRSAGGVGRDEKACEAKLARAGDGDSPKAETKDNAGEPLLEYMAQSKEQSGLQRPRQERKEERREEPRAPTLGRGEVGRMQPKDQ
eukprot:TRINITY_DN10370_c0_g1_i1.p2 TRINITY_DN10370_c0_g1~~TRINITY_DN10370_c0_g1_i1.p2  ORF type:complete len:122 (+),score=19.94 TRINITY_DN10370_c0_g1_i1:166-531(+)